jgi:hypothetical protein
MRTALFVASFCLWTLLPSSAQHTAPTGVSRSVRDPQALALLTPSLLAMGVCFFQAVYYADRTEIEYHALCMALFE